MQIVHNQAAPTEAAQAEPARPMKDDEIRGGLMMGIAIRSAINPDSAKEYPTSAEVGMQICQLLLNYATEQAEVLTRRLEEVQGKLDSATVLHLEKGGMQNA